MDAARTVVLVARFRSVAQSVRGQIVYGRTLCAFFGFLLRWYAGKKGAPNRGLLPIDQLQWDIHRGLIFLQKADRSKGGSDLEPLIEMGALEFFVQRVRGKDVFGRTLCAFSRF